MIHYNLKPKGNSVFADLFLLGDDTGGLAVGLGFYAVDLFLCYCLAIEAALEVVDRDGLRCGDAVID